MTEIEKCFVQIDYIFDDLRSSLRTTDVYIEHYMPFKILKQTLKLFTDSFSSPPEEEGSLTRRSTDLVFSREQEVILNKLEDNLTKDFYGRFI